MMHYHLDDFPSINLRLQRFVHLGDFIAYRVYHIVRISGALGKSAKNLNGWNAAGSDAGGNQLKMTA
jgi:hypothetical protein